MTKRKKVLRTAPRRFSEEFKDEALRQLAERRAAGEPVDRIARDLDIDPTLLRVWARTRGAAGGVVSAAAIEGGGDGTALAESPAAELRRLRRENARLRQEQEFLKKAAAFFAKESR
jgi:transposase